MSAGRQKCGVDRNIRRPAPYRERVFFVLEKATGDRRGPLTDLHVRLLLPGASPDLRFRHWSRRFYIHGFQKTQKEALSTKKGAVGAEGH